MKTLCAGLVVVGLLALSGCSNKSTTGGEKDKGGTFTIKGPKSATDVKQGGEANVKLTFDRSKDYTQDVKVKFEVVGDPKGITFDPANPTVKAGDSPDLGITVKASDDAPRGKHTVNVVGTPSKGGPSSQMAFEINVEPKK